MIGENKDRGSETKLSELLAKVERSPVTIDTLAYSSYLTAFATKGSEYSPSNDGDWLLRGITETARLGRENTGGRTNQRNLRSYLSL